VINLLNPHDKKELRAARRNTIWSRYTLLAVALLITVNIILGLTFFFTLNQAQIYKQRIADNQAQSNKSYSGTRAKSEAFRKNLTTAKALLGAETNYSSIIVTIANTVPGGCVMSSLTLNPQSFGVTQSFNFKCRAKADIIRLKTALERNSATFDKVNIVSTFTSPPNGAESFPVTVTMSLILKKPLPTTTTGNAS